jgi:integrase
VTEQRPGLKDVRRPAELMHAYITLGLLTGIRTEEARAPRWAHVDLDGDPAARPASGSQPGTTGRTPATPPITSSNE